MIYEWDTDKAAANQRKHGVSFDDARTVFLDPFALTFDDPDHSLEERRFITIGMMPDQRLIFAHGRQHVVKVMTTKNAERITDDLRPEYDLSKLTGAVRGKYYKRATAGTTLVLLEPDVAEAFPDGQIVNEVLRAVAKVAHTQRSSIESRLPKKTSQATSRVHRKSKVRKSPRSARD